MGTWKQAGRSRMGATGILIAVLVGVAALAIGLTVHEDRALAQEGLEGAMALTADGSDVSCSSGSCDVPVGGDFTLSVSTAGVPAGGYIGIQTQVYYLGVMYMPTEVDETYTGAGEDVWPDNDGQGGLSLRAPQQLRRGWVAHGGVSDFVPPFDEPSTYEGTLVQLAMRCPDAEGSHTLYLLAYDRSNNVGGATYSGVDAGGTAQVTVPVASSDEVDLELEGSQTEGPYAVGDSLEINCVVEEEEEEEEDVTEEPEPTSTPPDALPPTGSAVVGGGGAGASAWAIMTVLFIAGAGLLTAGRRYARSRQTS